MIWQVVLMEKKKNFEYYQEVLNRLEGYRTAWNITKAEMARKLSIDRSLYSRIEKGTKSITNDVLLKMYEIGIDIDYLVTGIKSEDTKLNLLLKQCRMERRSNFINIMVSYMNALLENDTSKRLYCRKELEILKYNIDKKNGERAGTVWLCIREIHDFTQAQLRDVLDINIKTYRKMEKGEIMPTLEVLVNLYLELGYYPSLVQEIDSDYLLMINNAWKALSEENKETMEKIAEKTLKDLNEI